LTVNHDGRDLYDLEGALDAVFLGYADVEAFLDQVPVCPE
jgi:hypothetical protein